MLLGVTGVGTVTINILDEANFFSSEVKSNLSFIEKMISPLESIELFNSEILVELTSKPHT